MSARSAHVRVFTMTRLGNSKDGNPRYDLYTSRGTYRTANDASCAYENPESWLGKWVTLHLDDRSQVARVIVQ